jgi:hypothetical protein
MTSSTRQSEVDLCISTEHSNVCAQVLGNALTKPKHQTSKKLHNTKLIKINISELSTPSGKRKHLHSKVSKYEAQANK